MEHQKVQRTFLRIVEGGARSAAVDQAFVHLEHCEECRDALSQYSNLIAVEHTLAATNQNLVPDLSDVVLAAIEDLEPDSEAKSLRTSKPKKSKRRIRRKSAATQGARRDDIELRLLLQALISVVTVLAVTVVALFRIQSTALHERYAAAANNLAVAQAAIPATVQVVPSSAVTNNPQSKTMTFTVKLPAERIPPAGIQAREITEQSADVEENAERQFPDIGSI